MRGKEEKGKAEKMIWKNVIAAKEQMKKKNWRKIRKKKKEKRKKKNIDKKGCYSTDIRKKKKYIRK